MRFVLLVVLAGCTGEIGTPTGSPTDPVLPEDPTPGDPGDPPVLRCDGDRGHARGALRRLTRDELVATIRTSFGDEVVAREAVREAITRIPPESPYDLVHDFDEDHVAQHVEGLLAVAEAVAPEVAAGLCDAPDRGCAEHFLDGPALQLLRRPLASDRRTALLQTYDAAALTRGQRAALERLVTLVLQAPELAFHLDVPAVDCERAAPVHVAVDDARWDGGGARSEGTVDGDGWFVWELPAPAALTSYAVPVEVTGAPVRLRVNVDDASSRPERELAAGDHVLEGALSHASAQPLKIGVQVLFGGAAEVRFGDLVLTAAERCEAAPTDDERFRVDGYTVAARLAYGLTGGPPDMPLLARAGRGDLGTEEAAREEAERLLGTSAAREHFDALLSSWLLLHEVDDPHAEIATANGIEAAGLADEARRELLDYARHMVFDAGANAEALMAEPLGFPRSERMAALYESEVAAGDEPVDLPAGHGGLLLRVAPMLAGNLDSSPILRGVYVRKRLLCTELDSPPFEIVQEREDALEASDRRESSTREIVTELTSGGVCAGCHQDINPIGFTLEGFDGMGRARDEQVVYDDAGNELARHPLDTSVDAVDVGQGTHAVPDAETLNGYLAGSAVYHDCIAERLYTWLHLREPEGADACALADVQTLVREGAPLREAWIAALVNDDLFHRSER